MKTRLYIIIGCVGLIIFGGYLNFEHYQNSIRPLNTIENNLSKIISTSDEMLISDYLLQIKIGLHFFMENLPDDKNPVWNYPTESTNFLKIEKNVDRMTMSINKISSISKDNSAYHTGMLDINDMSEMLLENIRDAKGFAYASITNIIFTLMWVTGVVGLIVVKTR
jgi:hypothetical protein